MINNSKQKLAENIDEAEIAKFEAMAPIWWDKQGDFKGLHGINVLRLNYINERAPLAGKTVLDAGCGGGILSEAMASLGAVEISRNVFMEMMKSDTQQSPTVAWPTELSVGTS